MDSHSITMLLIPTLGNRIQHTNKNEANIKLYLLIKRNSSTSAQITIFVSIFGLPTFVNHKERARRPCLSKIHGIQKGLGRIQRTSNKYNVFQKIVLLLQLSQKITNSKIGFYISENYKQQNRSLHLRKLQTAIPASTSQKITRSKRPIKAKTT